MAQASLAENRRANWQAEEFKERLPCEGVSVSRWAKPGAADIGRTKPLGEALV